MAAATACRASMSSIPRVWMRCRMPPSCTGIARAGWRQCISTWLRWVASPTSPQADLFYRGAVQVPSLQAGGKTSPSSGVICAAPDPVRSRAAAGTALRPSAQKRAAAEIPAREDGEDGAPGGIRTPDQWLRKPLLYPAELRARCVLRPAGPPDGATDRQSGAGGAFYP